MAPISPLVVEHGKEGALMAFLTEELYPLTREGWEQEDDIPSLLYDLEWRDPDSNRGHHDFQPYSEAVRYAVNRCR